MSLGLSLFAFDASARRPVVPHLRHGTSAPAQFHGHAARDEDVPPVVLAAFASAQTAAQADPSVLLAIAYKESSFNPTARNRLSSAYGLLQFTEATWLEMIRDFGARYNLSAYATALYTDRDGNISARNRRMRAAILRLRGDPRLSAIMAAERLRSKAKTLSAQLGRDLLPADLYVLYLLGPDGAHHFLIQLAEHPDLSSVAVIGGSARPNAGLFVRAGHALTVADAYAAIDGMISQQQQRYASQLRAIQPTEIAWGP